MDQLQPTRLSQLTRKADIIDDFKKMAYVGTDLGMTLGPREGNAWT